jgi:hypothetical protein
MIVNSRNVGISRQEKCNNAYFSFASNPLSETLTVNARSGAAFDKHQKVRAAIVPESPALDRLLRHGAGLDRSFDRMLTQLEHLQRMRSGQPVLPKLEVRHSLS